MGELPPSRLSPSPPPPPPPPPPLPPLSPLPYEVLFSEQFDDLTEPLPTPEEIEDSPHIIRALSARCTTYVGESFVVKYGVEIEPLEGHNMRFVRQNTDIVVPRLLAIYQLAIAPGKHVTYLIMEKIPGDTLETVWNHLDGLQRQAITVQLRKAFDSLRDIPHPGVFGSIDKSGLRDSIFWTSVPTPAINGPFATEDQLVEGMVGRYVQDGGPRMQHKADYYRRVLPKALRGNEEPVFTHADFQRKNIIVRPDGSIAMLDWAASGWYPSYWEYATAIYACGMWMDDWHAHLGKILDEHPNQFVWMSAMRAEMWG